MEQDSRKFDPAIHGLERSVDVVFIDGGHDTETVTIDTATNSSTGPSSPRGG